MSVIDRIINQDRLRAKYESNLKQMETHLAELFEEASILGLVSSARRCIPDYYENSKGPRDKKTGMLIGPSIIKTGVRHHVFEESVLFARKNQVFEINRSSRSTPREITIPDLDTYDIICIVDSSSIRIARLYEGEMYLEGTPTLDQRSDLSLDLVALLAPADRNILPATTLLRPFGHIPAELFVPDGEPCESCLPHFVATTTPQSGTIYLPKSIAA
jgi:hypothetical protein